MRWASLRLSNRCVGKTGRLMPFMHSKRTAIVNGASFRAMKSTCSPFRINDKHSSTVRCTGTERKRLGVSSPSFARKSMARLMAASKWLSITSTLTLTSASSCLLFSAVCAGVVLVVGFAWLLGTAAPLIDATLSTEFSSTSGDALLLDLGLFFPFECPPNKLLIAFIFWLTDDSYCTAKLFGCFSQKQISNFMHVLHSFFLSHWGIMHSSLMQIVTASGGWCVHRLWAGPLTKSNFDIHGLNPPEFPGR